MTSLASRPDSHELLITSSPGSHDLDLSLNRRVNFDEAFGGLKKLKNTITVKCTMGIPDQVRGWGYHRYKWNTRSGEGCGYSLHIDPSSARSVTRSH